MRPIDAILRVMPPDAVELRVVRFRVRATPAESVNAWLGDALFGAEDGGGATSPRPLRVGRVDWFTVAGESVATRLEADETVESADLVMLMAEARRRRLRFSIWSETDSSRAPSMQLSEIWFTGADAVPDAPPSVEETASGDHTEITVQERIPRQPWFLLMLPIVAVSFAWVFFLFMGSLPKMVREIWQRGARGIRQRSVFTLDADHLRVVVERNGSPFAEMTIDRPTLLAIGTVGGLRAYAGDEVIELPDVWVSADGPAIRTAVAARLNRALGAS